jgi:hypothetical protein
LRAAAYAYFAYFGNKTVEMPWGVPCTRVKGGKILLNRDLLNYDLVGEIMLFGRKKELAVFIFYIYPLLEGRGKLTCWRTSKGW